MKKRIWAVLLAVCLAVGLLPTIALAGGGDVYGPYNEGFLEIVDKDGASTIVRLSETKEGSGWAYERLTLTLTDCDLQRIHFYPYKEETSVLTIEMVGNNNVSASDDSELIGGILNFDCVDLSRKAGDFIFTGDGSLTTDHLQIQTMGGDNKASATIRSGIVTVNRTAYMDGGTLTVEQDAAMNITGDFPKIHCTVAGTLSITAIAGNSLYWQKSGADSCYNIIGTGVIVANGGLCASEASGLLTHYDVKDEDGQACVLSTARSTPSPKVVLTAESDEAVDPVYIRAKANHTWAAQTKDATCTAVGTITYSCAACNESWTETIPALGHDYKQEVTKKPTANTEGEETITCSRCDYHETQVLPVTGEKTIAVTSSENGSVFCPFSTARPGILVNITVVPNPGYQSGTPVVRDTSGNLISVTKANENTYTFIMPDADVTVEGTFTTTGPVGVNGGYTAYPADERGNRMADGYITIEFGKTGLGEVKANSAYLVQIVNGGQSILFIAHSDNTSLRFLCNKAGNLWVWELPANAGTNIESLTLSMLQNKQIITGDSIAALPAYTGN